MGRLGGKVAAVTGGASGIGEATARLFAEEGAQIAIADLDVDRGRHVADEIRGKGVRAVFVETHTEREAEAIGFIRRAREEFGRLDVLVNNAGMTHFVAHTDLDALTDAVWDEIFQVNLKGAFYCTRAAMPLLKERHGNVVAVRGDRGCLVFDLATGDETWCSPFELVDDE